VLAVGKNGGIVYRRGFGGLPEHAPMRLAPAVTRQDRAGRAILVGACLTPGDALDTEGNGPPGWC
jgi:hypothetical protein